MANFYDPGERSVFYSLQERGVFTAFSVTTTILVSLLLPP